VIWSFSGLENALYALLATCIAVVLLRATVRGKLLRTRVAVLAGVLTVFAALTRPDGLGYVVAYPLTVLILLRREAVPTSLRSAALNVASFAAPTGRFSFCGT
jgi:ethanolamine utilization microcompartment shell protein EutL